jgi:hypothetical protein
MENGYCKMFVNAALTEDELLAQIAAILGASRESCWIRCAEFHACIWRNGEFSAEKAGEEDGFLYWPYFLDIEPTAGTSDAAYVAKVKQLFKALRGRGYGVVAACDFEEELER